MLYSQASPIHSTIDSTESAEAAREEEEQHEAETVANTSTVSRASATFSTEMGRQCSAGVAVLRKLRYATRQYFSTDSISNGGTGFFVTVSCTTTQES